MSLELGANHLGRPGEQEPEILVTRGSQSAVDDAAGSVVAPHRVYGDADHSEELRLVDCAYLSTAVVPAVRTRAVWLLRLAAIRAVARLRRHERIVGAPLGRARLGMPPFRIRHGVNL
jgi:hypothetical protein